MQNVCVATLASHDAAQGASWIAWNGVRVRVPFAGGIKVGSPVRWTIASEQIRLPARSARPERPDDTPFRARLLAVTAHGTETRILVAPADSPEHSLVLTVAADIVARKGLREGDEVVLRLRGDAIGVASASPSTTRLGTAFAAGAAVGTLGGLIGLGGAEFRLPILIALFGFTALSAVILNKAMSLVVVAAALVFRTGAVPVDAVSAHWPVIVNLLSGSLVGAWFGAGWATRAKASTLYRVIAVLLVLIALVLLVGHDAAVTSAPWLTGWPLWAAGAAAGFGIGVVAALLGVAGGELLIPTLVLLFGVDVKLAGSLSLAVSLPTMIVGFARYSGDRSFAVLAQNKELVCAMAAGSLAGAGVGGLLLTWVSSSLLLPLLAAILVLSAAKVWRHR